VIATFLLMLFMNITESNFFRPSNLLWIMFIVAALRVHYEGVVRMSNAARQPRPRPVRMEQRA
jgi:O-antigen ligase